MNDGAPIDHEKNAASGSDAAFDFPCVSFDHLSGNSPVDAPLVVKAST